MNSSIVPAASSERCRVSLLTPAGRGAIATIGVAGRSAAALVGRRFAARSGRALESYGLGSIVVGDFRSSLGAAEELVVGLIDSQQVEVHCHGGRAAVEAIVQALVDEGCERQAWEAWLQAGSSDRLQAAALRGLALTRTERTAALLLSQYRGALRATLVRIARALTDDRREEAAAGLDELLGRVSVGCHLTQPWKVVLAGRPNVGKSSLINALLGYRRSIVFDEPGTTRDVLTASMAIEGWPIELSDTAGLRQSDDALESAGIERAREQLREADLILAVFEFPQPWTAADEHFLASLPEPTPRLLVFNKCDLAGHAAGGRPNGIAVSATSGEGMPELTMQIARTLVPNPPQPGDAIPFANEHAAQLARARHLLTAGEVEGAAGAIRELLG